MSDSTGVRTTRCNTGCLDVSSNMFPQFVSSNVFPQTCFLEGKPHFNVPGSACIFLVRSVVAMATIVRRPFSNPDL